MHRAKATFLSLVLTAAIAAAPAAAASLAGGPPPSGTFTGEGLTLVLKATGSEYTGTATLNGATFDLRGQYDTEKRGGGRLEGTFTSNGNTYTWSAVVEGQTLKFQTGGTEYKLPIPTPPPADNPLAKKPVAPPADNPLSKKPDAAGNKETPPAAAAASTPSGALKFKRFAINDPGINNIEAISFLIPDGWKAEGNMVWFPDYSILANLRLTITDPETGGQIQALPAQNFTWIDNPVMPMQPGQNYMGNIVQQPIKDIPRFIQMAYAPQFSTHLAGLQPVTVENLDKLAQQVSGAYGGQSQVVAQRVRYEYQKAGKPWEEDVFVALVFTSQQGMTIWTVNTAYAFRAPKGELDKLAPRMTTTVSTARLSPDWFGGYMYVQQLFMNRMNQGIKNAAAISETVTRNSEEIRRMFSDSYKKQCDSQDRISRGFGEHIRGVETYTNPFDSRPVELPSGYKEAWVNSSGEYLLLPQSGVDPNVGSTVEWKRMNQAP